MLTTWEIDTRSAEILGKSRHVSVKLVLGTEEEEERGKAVIERIVETETSTIYCCRLPKAWFDQDDRHVA